MIPDVAEAINTGERIIPDDTETLGAPLEIIDDSEPTDQQRMRLIELSGTLDFWDDPQEDIYTLDDGEPV